MRPVWQITTRWSGPGLGWTPALGPASAGSLLSAAAEQEDDQDGDV